MSDLDDALELGAHLVQNPSFHWMPGMRAILGAESVRVHVTGEKVVTLPPDDGAIVYEAVAYQPTPRDGALARPWVPDLRDTATLLLCASQWGGSLIDEAIDRLRDAISEEPPEGVIERGVKS